MNTIDGVKARIMDLCAEYEVFGDVAPEHYARADLIEHGLVDSMATVYLQELLQENFAVDMPPELFALELRTMDALAEYVHAAQAA